MPAAPLIERWRRFASADEEPRGAWIALMGFLALVSAVYGVLSSILTWFASMRSVRVAVPVISVGNVVVGGTGKTPLVIHIARMLARDGRSVAVVSRGFGRESRGTVEVSRGSGPLVRWSEAGDEPYLISLLTESVAVVVSSQRAAGARYAVEKLGADVILLDDGFQHVRLSRDLDIVAIDAARPVGNGYLVPGGILRERLSGIRRAGLIVLTRCDETKAPEAARRSLGRVAPGIPVVETRMRPAELWDVGTRGSVELSEVRGLGVLALSSVGNPVSFTAALERLGFGLVANLNYPDHHRYTRGDLAGIEELACSSGAHLIVTTEKDAVRVSHWRPRVRVLALGIELEVLRGSELLSRAVSLGDRRRRKG